MDWNHYYRLAEPVFYLDRMGWAKSNTYIGSSQVLDTIYVGRNAWPGDEFHLLAGGDFLLQADGEIKDVSFWFPKHIFEKSYGGEPTSKGLFAELEKQGVVQRIEAPDGKLPYAAARREEEYPANHPRMAYDEHSTMFEELRDGSSFLRDMANDHGLQANLYDFHLERRAKLQIVKPTEKGRSLVMEIHAREQGDLFVRASEDHFDIESFREMAHTLPDVDPPYISSNCFWVRSHEIFNDETFLNEMESRLEGAANGFKATRPAGP